MKTCIVDMFSLRQGRGFIVICENGDLHEISCDDKSASNCKSKCENLLDELDQFINSNDQIKKVK